MPEVEAAPTPRPAPPEKMRASSRDVLLSLIIPFYAAFAGLFACSQQQISRGVFMNSLSVINLFIINAVCDRSAR